MKRHILSGFSSVGRAFDCRGLLLILLLVSNCRWFDSGKPELNKNNRILIIFIIFIIFIYCVYNTIPSFLNYDDKLFNEIINLDTISIFCKLYTLFNIKYIKPVNTQINNKYTNNFVFIFVLKTII